jgi:hypothetical protein
MDAKHRTRNPEIPGLRFAHPGMTAEDLPDLPRRRPETSLVGLIRY